MNFARQQHAKSARLQIFQSQSGEFHAPQRACRVADEFQHSPHLPVAPFAQRQLY